MPPAKGKEYRYMGNYAGTLGNGQPVEPGETVKLDSDAVELSQDMIESGQLIEVKEGGG